MSESHGLKGCSNCGCLVDPPPNGAMVTNAMCKCLQDRILAERLVIWLRAEVAAKNKRIVELAERLNIAEAKLTRLGYERECNIPACNCGDGWTHKRAEV